MGIRRRQSLSALMMAAAAMTLASCAAMGTDTPSSATGGVPTPVPTPASTPPGIPPIQEDAVTNTVRFTGNGVSVDVTLADNPAARDFAAMLPLTVALEEFNGREKIAYLPRALTTEGTPGSDPEDGDLIYYIPWGNLGFYYDTTGVGYSDQTLNLGTYTATVEQLTQLQGESVTVEVVP
jgi:hypothetical protein